MLFTAIVLILCIELTAEGKLVVEVVVVEEEEDVVEDVVDVLFASLSLPKKIFNFQFIKIFME